MHVSDRIRASGFALDDHVHVMLIPGVRRDPQKLSQRRRLARR